MSQERAIVPRKPAGEVALISNLDDAYRMAKYVAESKLFGCTNPAEALVKIVAGLEMGFAAIASMTDIHLIEGKPSVGAHLMAAAIRRSGKYDFEIREHTDEVCSIAFLQMKSGQMKEVGVITTTLKEAKEKGWNLTQGGKEKMTWRTKPKNMLFARTISDGYKFYTPDLTGGMLVYDRDEIEVEVSHAQTPNVQVISRPNGTSPPQIEHAPDSERSTALQVNDDGSLTDDVDLEASLRHEIAELVTELGFTGAQVKKKLDQSYGGVESIYQLYLADLEKMKSELLAAKAKRLGNGKSTTAAAPTA